jgi:hypothetical protein
MPIDDIYGFTLAPPPPGYTLATSTMTLYTPSNRVVQGAISIADTTSEFPSNSRAAISQINISGYGDLPLPGGVTTVRWAVNSITFSLLSTFPYSVYATILVAIYSE